MLSSLGFLLPVILTFYQASLASPKTTQKPNPLPPRGFPHPLPKHQCVPPTRGSIAGQSIRLFMASILPTFVCFQIPFLVSVQRAVANRILREPQFIRVVTVSNGMAMGMTQPHEERASAGASCWAVTVLTVDLRAEKVTTHSG
uniref:Uncharacterized protein n=1 Tax=Candidatus Kentrum sp. MB TaxID=2138164 RepID=A0A450Y0D6_9GAMM|nr:MAG: hypothetical protein BECKMB1821G_GA0114241_10984 [Candidatus Kentron sp. MB]VFK34990.1 MAG: hypothetical protein BECKMB1821I_GA0114274_109410 [Candidatus Kentron sp. MB]VFK77092.1 MAG: hypothetical protein BECKMB1821H_GA0114242_10994 [Candidatus Kentron sp. MB]